MKAIVKRFSGSGHIILSKKLIGKEVFIFTSEELENELKQANPFVAALNDHLKKILKLEAFKQGPPGACLV